MSERERILELMVPMFIEARAKGLWFFCKYQNLWFSPDELAKQHNDGKFVWNVSNFTLRHPREGLQYLMQKSRDAEAEVQRFANRMQTSLEAPHGG